MRRYRISPNIRRPPIFPMRKSEKSFFSKTLCHLVLRDVSKKEVKTILFEIIHSKFNTLNIILGVFTKISIVPIKIFMAPLRNSSRGLVSHRSSDRRETSVDHTQSVSWRSDVSPISGEMNHAWQPARSS
jgi:hypothetical protein